MTVRKRFRIPDVDVRLDLDEVAVTQTRSFQRLSDIRQLGLAHLVYPAATHTRAAHSIQTLLEADTMLGAIRRNEAEQSSPPPPITEAEEQDVRMAALLHDIGHLPFSHMLEDENAVLPKHDDVLPLTQALGMLKTELSERQDVITRIEGAERILLKLAGEKAQVDWQCDLVGNTVCADLLAYISADAKWTGIEKRPGSYRIYDYLHRNGNRLCVKLTKGALRNDVVSCITDLLDMRYALTERVIYHHGKAVASAMLARAASIAELQKVDRGVLLNFGDEAFLSFLNDRLVEQGETEATALMQGLRRRQLYKRVFRVTRKARAGRDEGMPESEHFCKRFRDQSVVTKLLDDVEEDNSLPRGSLAIWCPSEESSMKLARTQVIWDSGDIEEGPYELRGGEVEKRFPGVHSRVKSIEDLYLDLWTCWVAIHPKLVGSAAAIVKDLEERLEVKCDPLFVDGYLRKLPGFPASEDLVDEVTGELRPITYQVAQAVSDQARRPAVAGAIGGGSAGPEILEVARDSIDAHIRKGKKPRGSRRKQSESSKPAQQRLSTDVDPKSE